MQQQPLYMAHAWAVPGEPGLALAKSDKLCGARHGSHQHYPPVPLLCHIYEVQSTRKNASKSTKNILLTPPRSWMRYTGETEGHLSRDCLRHAIFPIRLPSIVVVICTRPVHPDHLPVLQRLVASSAQRRVTAIGPQTRSAMHSSLRSVHSVVAGFLVQCETFHSNLRRSLFSF